MAQHFVLTGSLDLLDYVSSFMKWEGLEQSLKVPFSSKFVCLYSSTLIFNLKCTFLSFLLKDAVVRNVYYKYFHPKEALVSNGVLNR